MANSTSAFLSKSGSKFRHALASLVAGASLLTLGALTLPDEASAQRGHHGARAGHAGARMAVSGARIHRGPVYSGARYTGARYYSGARYYGGYPYGYRRGYDYGWNPGFALTAGLLGLGVGLASPYAYGYGPYHGYPYYDPYYSATYYGAAGGCVLRSRVVINRFGQARRVVRRVCY